MQKQKLRPIIERIVKDIIFESKLEYVIWGIPPNKTDETLLLTAINGKKITDINKAKEYMDILKTKHNCSKLRIQSVNLYDNDIFNLKK
jgi:hypothetical protein